MKFGKSLFRFLQAEVQAERRDAYIDYKALKKILKEFKVATAAATPITTTTTSAANPSSSILPESKFFQRLEAELAKTNEFYVIQERKFRSELRQLMMQFDNCFSNNTNAANNNNNNNDNQASENDNHDATATTAAVDSNSNNNDLVILEQQLKALFLQLNQLKRFCSINYMAATKILKKCNKVLSRYYQSVNKNNKGNSNNNNNNTRFGPHFTAAAAAAIGSASLEEEVFARCERFKAEHVKSLEFFSHVFVPSATKKKHNNNSNNSSTTTSLLDRLIKKTEVRFVLVYQHRAMMTTSNSANSKFNNLAVLEEEALSILFNMCKEAKIVVSPEGWGFENFLP